MSKFFSSIAFRIALTIIAMLIIGALIWFAGPFLAFGGLRPFATVTMRISTIVFLLVFLCALLLSVPMHVVGMTAASLLIWHAGPLLTFGQYQPLAPMWVRALVIVALLLIYVGYFLYRLYHRAADDQQFRDSLFGQKKDPNAPPDLVNHEQVKAMQNAFTRSLKQLKKMPSNVGALRRLVEGNRYLYQKPWYMVIGVPGAGKTTALVNSGLEFPLPSQTGAVGNLAAMAAQGGTANCEWWLTNEAVLIDTAGRYSTQDDREEKKKATDKAEWLNFLGLLRKYRTRAPINGAIVTINIGDLVMLDPAERLVYAGQIRTRLAELRTELGIRFPVYVMITKMDLLEGFSEYMRSLTESRSQVWGFTLPYTKNGKTIAEKDTTALKAQLQSELQALTLRLKEGRSTRFREEYDSEEGRRLLYALPQSFAGLTEPLVQTIAALFHDSSYDTTEINTTLRGVYFTSAAQGQLSVPTNSQSFLQRLLQSVAGTKKTQLSDKALASMVAESDAASTSAETEVSTDNVRPLQATAGAHSAKLLVTQPSGILSYFLTDLFAKVIIPEAHLVRPNLRWEFRFRLLRLFGHALVIAIALWWAGGILLSFDQNKAYLQSVTEKTGYLKQRVEKLFATSGSDKMLMVPDTLGAAQELPLYRDLDLNDPSSSFRFGLYNAPPVADAAHNTYAHLQDSLLLPEILRRMEEVLGKAIADKDTKTAYDTLRVYLQLHDKAHYNAADVKTWVTNDWAASDSSTVFGSRSSMTNHVNQLFSGDRIVQSPFLENKALIEEARDFLGDHPSTERLFNRAKAAMQSQAPQDFTLTRAVGPQAGTVFARASGKPLEQGVPGIYTYDGYHDVFSKRLPEFVKQAQLDDAWVMGNDRLTTTLQKKTTDLVSGITTDGMDDDPITQDIRRQYLTEYAQHWDDFLSDIRTVTGSNLSFDLTVLRAFAAPDSPLSRLARAAARETTLSRPLVTNDGGDKSFLDKATDKIAQKGRDAIGISPQERLEKELVDNRFAALREVVTGQADAGQTSTAAAGSAATSGLDNITGLLNQYYTLLVVADTALNANSLPPGSLDAGMKLKLEGDKLPAPFKEVLTALADSGNQKIADGSAAILQKQAQQQVDRIKSMLAYQVTDMCQTGIEGLYPFNPKATQDVSLDDFRRVFGAGGPADVFFKTQLAPFVDMSQRPWKYKSPDMVNPLTPAEIAMTGLGLPAQGANSADGAIAGAPDSPTLLGELLKLLAKQGPNPETFARMQTIREAFFQGEGSKKMLWTMDVKVKELDPTILELIMDFDGQVQRYAHGPTEKLVVNWPGPRGGEMTELTATPRIKPDTSTINTRGAWALFRLLERGKPLPNAANGRASIEYDFDGRKAVLEMNTGTLPNPLVSNLFKGFSCPGSGS
ncbi:type VI secretion system membrane subunit TssM [Glaciimonas soli]|uniref:Type VI secretion system membrane subunit TssM n=1 Tax=Glaciimonas soli TaxID=2590999 RepID=A0A843YWM0_9BURK|nr:type VI secretion system membrane subunit TssM [Glaciimonas soli]MQR02093.1 type VI secretion system membrane subunit TssM [Glaciimonas soli]